MKHLERIILGLVLAVSAWGFSSCSNNDHTTTAISATVTISLPDGFSSSAYYSGQTVNLLSGGTIIYSATTDSLGKATFTGVVPGIYDISSTWSLDGTTYQSMASSSVENIAVVLTASATSVTLSTEGQSVELTASLSVQQSLLISKVFYAGNKDGNSKNYVADIYMQIFNNSDEDVSLDGLYIGIYEGESTPAYPITSSTTSSDSLYLRQVFQIPSGGYTLAAGKGVTIARSATDHTASLGPDLSTTDTITTLIFETKNTTYSQNSSIPEITLAYTAYTAIPWLHLMPALANSVVIFKTDNFDTSSSNIVYAPGKTSGTQFIRIPNSAVIDGVDLLKYRTALSGVNTDYKRLQTYIDATYQNISSTSGYTGEVIVRKTASYSNGRFYLQDTNTSQSDFSVVSMQNSYVVGPAYFLSPE